MTRAGVDPGPLDEVTWWQTHDRWVWTSTPSRSTCVSRPAALASRRRTVRAARTTTQRQLTRRTDVQNVRGTRTEQRGHEHRITHQPAPEPATCASCTRPPTRGRHRRLLLLHVGNLVVVVGRNEPAWAMNGVITFRDYGLVPLMFAEHGVRKRGRNKRRIRSCLTRPAGILAESASGSATSCCRSTSARRARGRQQVLRSRRGPRRRIAGKSRRWA